MRSVSIEEIDTHVVKWFIYNIIRGKLLVYLYYYTPPVVV
jgi:hypothetical protein